MLCRWDSIAALGILTQVPLVTVGVTTGVAAQTSNLFRSWHSVPIAPSRARGRPPVLLTACEVLALG